MHNCENRLIAAGNVLDRNGLTVVGRSLQKHGSRNGSVFPKAIGNISQINTQGEQMLNKIISYPKAEIVRRHHAKLGNIIEYRTPFGGARFSSDGEKFWGFIEP